MGVTSYLTWEGEILSETRSGVESDYLPDPLSSTAALLNSSQVKTDTFSWWPYGEQQTHSGTSVTRFGYVGTRGYYADHSTGNVYVRGNTLVSKLGSWQSIDPLWPLEYPYDYATGCPTSYIDPFGASPCQAVVGPPANNLFMVDERRVIPGLGFHSICHWWIELDCGRSDNSFGYGSQGLCNTYASNSDGQQVLESPILITDKQKKCVCDLVHNVVDLGWTLCGSQWRKCDYNFRTHNCQDYVSCICTKCQIWDCAFERGQKK